MIKKLHVKNYKCLRDVEVALKPLTVLIGKNDTGKTSLLEAIRDLAEIVDAKGASQEGSRAIDQLISSAAPQRLIEWTVTVEPSARNRLPSETTYSLAVGEPRGPGSFWVSLETVTVPGRDDIRLGVESREGLEVRFIREGANQASDSGKAIRAATALSKAAQQPGFPTLTALASSLGSTNLYRFDAAALASPSELTGFEDTPSLHTNGYGLPGVLDYLLGSKRAAFDRIEEELRAAVPFVKAILLKPQLVPGDDDEATTGKGLAFETPNGHAVPAHLTSDGVLFLLAYLTLVHAPGAPALVLLEEPENSIHPRQLERVVGFLQALSNPARGSIATQIILATHSPYLLDFVPPDCVLVFGRRKDSGDSVVAPLRTLPGVEERLRNGFSLGEMWFNVGEDVLLAELLGAPTPGE